VATIHQVRVGEPGTPDKWYGEPLGADRWDQLVQQLLEAGPNRWIEMPGGAQGGRRFVRGITGDYTGPPEEAFRETFAVLAGKPVGVKYAYGVDDGADIDRLTQSAAAYSRPLTIRGKADDLERMVGSEVRVPAGKMLDRLDGMGLFVSDDPSLQWAVQYLRFDRLALEAGIPVSARSRGGRFASDLEAAVERSAHQNPTQARETLRDVHSRYRDDGQRSRPPR